MATASAPKKPAARPDAKSAQRAAELLKTVADSTRIGVLLILQAGDRNVTDLCAELGQSQPGVSHHLAILRYSRVVDTRRNGKSVVYSLTDRGRALAKVVGVMDGDE